MDKFYDFNGCKESLKQFGGSDKKDSVFFCNKRYMLKYNDEIPPEKRNENTSSSRNNAFSEYISCRIFGTIGIPVQNTLLGERNGHIVVACEDFCVDGYDINEFEKNSSRAGYNFKDERYPDIDEVINFIRNDMRIDPRTTEKRFWDTFVMDAFLGNFDRHTGNWGYLYNDELHLTILAPVYDCGACLYPMLSDDGMTRILQSQDDIDERIYGYPKAAFTKSDQKISYHSFLTDKNELSNYPLLYKAVLDIGARLSLDKVVSVIDNTPQLSEVRRTFYKRILEERYEKIIVPSIEIAKAIGRTMNTSKNVGKY